MRLIALLSFYDEPIPDLVACITSLHDAGVDELVAVDGAYALYPNGRAASDPNQHAAIVLACRNLDIGCTLHVPRTVWAGGEVEKRSFHFKLALSVAQHGDWFWIIDADEVITQVPDDLKARLETTDHDAAEHDALDTVALRAGVPNMPPRFMVRHLFRAQEITVETNHCTFVTPDGRVLSAFEDGTRQIEPALDLTADVLIEHRPDRRPQERMLAKFQYYAARDQSLIERGTCARCAEPAIRLMPTRWRMTDLGPVADWSEACEPCAARLERINHVRLTNLGIDPDSMVVENRMGRPPARAPEPVT